MLTDEVPEDIIDEDLEALLYAQVHYGKQANEEPNLVESETTSQCKEVDEGVEATKPDSPETRCKTPPPKQYLEISTSMPGQSATSPTQVVTQIPVLSTQTPNNITINQYFYATDSFLNRFNRLKKSLRWTNKCEKDYQKLQGGFIKPKAFLSSLRRTARQQRQEKRFAKLKQKITSSKATLASKEVICLSDSDNSDIEIVERMEKSDGEGDEIIYVEPPPVPVISVADDSGEDEEGEIDVVGVGEGRQDDGADDFLGPASSTPNDKENFNFSLHGSDFQDVDFARPANPTADTYETESSTSTSDFNRESTRNFANTVKTIVFSEPDFPKDDIFEGGNLEKFDDLITPKRAAAPPAEDSPERGKPKEKRRKPKTSSGSSSESDYDYSEATRHLPDLSPVVVVERRADKTMKMKLKKKKKRPEEPEEPEKKKQKKDKKKPPVEEEEEEEEEEKRTKRKKSKKKKQKSSLLEAAEDGDTLETEIPEPSGEESVRDKVLVEEECKEDEEVEKTCEQEVEVEDIVLIEPVVPVYTIAESSSDSEGDILTFEDLSDELVLSNVQTSVVEPVETLAEDPDPFDMEILQNNMTDDPEKWKVLPADICYVPARNKIRRKCARCRETGHQAQNCTNKSNVPVCNLCGNRGHREARCPNKVCFSCANPGKYSLVYCHRCAKLRRRRCDTCRLQGHTSSSCPDAWRRYHLTTEEGPLVKPDYDNKRQSHVIKWCSGCASSGHYEHQCTSYKWNREYPAASPQIFDYRDLYGQNKMADSRDKPSTVTSQEAATLNPISPGPAHSRTPTSNNNNNRGRRHRVNPFSVMHGTQYAPYRSLLHPERHSPPFTFRGTPALTDFEVPYGSGGGAPNQQLSLFKPVPPPLMAQQVSNLWRSVHQTSYQANYGGGGEYNYTQDSYYAGRTDHQFEQQRIPSLTHYNEQHSRVNFNTGHMSQIQSNYIDFSLPLPPYNPPPTQPNPPQSDIFTLSREPDRENVNVAPTTLVIPERARPGIPQETFIPLAVTAQNRDKNYAPKLNNLEEGVKQKFLTLPQEELVQFLEEEIKKLTDIKSQEIRGFRKKLNGMEQLKSIEIKTSSVKKQIAFQFKRFNMYLFGVRLLDDGKRQLDFLRNRIHQGGIKLTEQKRKALMDAYGYIFGGEHPGLDYGEYLKRYVPTRFE